MGVGFVSIFLVSPMESRLRIIASTLPAVTLLFYVSERLRESAQRKLDYWNKTVLIPLYNVTEGVNPLYSAKYRADHLGHDRDLLKKHAKYGRFVNLYRKNFIVTLSTPQKNLLDYEEVYKNGLREGTKRLGPNLFNLGALFAAIGLVERGHYDETQIEHHRNGLKWTETT